MGNTSRSRGYIFEYVLVKRFNSLPNWYARRLGGSSTGLPDIVAVNNSERRLLTIEAKAGTSDSLYVPPDQIERCAKILEMFRVYEYRFAVLAFKFMSKRRLHQKRKPRYEHRQIHEYYKVINDLFVKDVMPTVRCAYDGRTFIVLDGVTKLVKLPDYLMPFQEESIQKVMVKHRTR